MTVPFAFVATATVLLACDLMDFQCVCVFVLECGEQSVVFGCCCSCCRVSVWETSVEFCAFGGAAGGRRDCGCSCVI